MTIKNYPVDESGRSQKWTIPEVDGPKTERWQSKKQNLGGSTLTQYTALFAEPSIIYGPSTFTRTPKSLLNLIPKS